MPTDDLIAELVKRSKETIVIRHIADADDENRLMWYYKESPYAVIEMMRKVIQCMQ